MRHCAIEVFWVSAVSIALEPVLRVEFFTQLGDSVLYRQLLGRERKIH